MPGKRGALCLPPFRRHPFRAPMCSQGRGEKTDVRSRISGSGERYDSGLMIGMNVMKGSEVCMQIDNEVLCATLGAHCGGWRNLAKCFLTKARVYYILRSKIKCSFLYQKTVSTKRKWIVSEIYYTPGNKISDLYQEGTKTKCNVSEIITEFNCIKSKTVNRKSEPVQLYLYQTISNCSPSHDQRAGTGFLAVFGREL